jgi:nucleoside-diphosphate-sugar epimerase
MILVTGGTGLVGAHLLYHLTLTNTRIRAIYRDEKSLEGVRKVFSFYASYDENQFSKIDWFQADITEVPAMIPAFEDIKKVYHCAAFISFHPKDYSEMRKVNIHGTAVVVNLSIAAKIDKICFVGSIASVGDALDGNLITEENEWNKDIDQSGYAITKFGGEMEIWRAGQEGIKMVIVNPGVILGSGFWQKGSGKLFSQMNKGFKYYTEGVTGFVGVKDVVKAMILLMNSEVNNERFILVSENKSFKEIFFCIADFLKKERPSKKIKPWKTAILWRFSWLISSITGKDPLLTKHTAKSAHSSSLYDSEKIKKRMDFEFEPIEKVIKQACKNFNSFP